MPTWNKKQRAEMRALQLKKAAPKRQVLCLKCHKVHDHPVCDSVRKAFVAAGQVIARKKEKRRLELKKAAREHQEWSLKRKSADRAAKSRVTNRGATHA